MQQDKGSPRWHYMSALKLEKQKNFPSFYSQEIRHHCSATLHAYSLDIYILVWGGLRDADLVLTENNIVRYDSVNDFEMFDYETYD